MQSVAPPAELPALDAFVNHVLDARRSMAARVWMLALPAMGQQFLVLLVGLSDRFLAGHLRDEHVAEFQAAQTTANYLGWFVTCSTVLISVGATAVVANAIGASDRRTAIRATHQALLLAVLIGVVGGVAGVLALPTVVGLLQLTGPAATHAIAFLTPLFWFLPCQVIEAAGIACLVGAGDTRTGLWVRAGIVLVNLPLAWLLCFHLGYGFSGIAWGTATSHCLGSVAVLSVLACGRAGLKLQRAQFRPDGPLCARLLRVSVPAAFDNFSLIAGQMWFLSIVNRLGTVPAAAHGIALGWEALGYQSAAAFGVAAMTMVGQHRGARDERGARRGGWTAFGLGVAVTTGMGGVFYVFAPAMFALFCPDPSQAEIIIQGVPALRLIAWGTPALAATMVLTAALRGAGDARVPVLFTWIGFLLVRIPLAYALTPHFGLLGAWMAMVTDLYVRGLFVLWRWAGGRWRRAHV